MSKEGETKGEIATDDIVESRVEKCRYPGCEYKGIGRLSNIKEWNGKNGGKVSDV